MAPTHQWSINKWKTKHLQFKQILTMTKISQNNFDQWHSFGPKFFSRRSYHCILNIHFQFKTTLLFWCKNLIKTRRFVTFFFWELMPEIRVTSKFGTLTPCQIKKKKKKKLFRLIIWAFSWSKNSTEKYTWIIHISGSHISGSHVYLAKHIGMYTFSNQKCNRIWGLPAIPELLLQQFQG